MQRADPSHSRHSSFFLPCLQMRAKALHFLHFDLVVPCSQIVGCGPRRTLSMRAGASMPPSFGGSTTTTPGGLNQLCAIPGDPPAGDIGGGTGGGTGGGAGGDTGAGAASATLPCTPCGVQGGITTATSSPGMAPSLAMTVCKSNPARCCQAGDRLTGVRGHASR